MSSNKGGVSVMRISESDQASIFCCSFHTGGRDYHHNPPVVSAVTVRCPIKPMGKKAQPAILRF